MRKFENRPKFILVPNMVDKRTCAVIMKYPYLRALDAIQLSTAIDVRVDAFLTNDNKLENINMIRHTSTIDQSDKQERNETDWNHADCL